MTRTCLSNRRLRWLVAVAAAGLFGCGGSTPTRSDNDPRVTLTSPGDGATVSGSVVIKADAANCDIVRFYVDDTLIDADTTAPYEIAWNTGAVANGTHSVEARGEGSGGHAEDAVSINVQNVAGEIIVTVSPLVATVHVGQAVPFTAQVTGSTETGVDWSLDRGASWGSVSATGLYTAPTTLPSPPTVTVTATSRADNTKSAAAVVTLTDNGPVTPDLKALSVDLFGLARAVADFGVEAVNTAAEAVWGASELNGAATLTGTLTQVSSGSDDWTYSAQPSDRLIVALAGGPTIEFVFALFEGYTEGTWEDFVDAHRLDFVIRIPGTFDIRVVSDRHFVGGAEVPYTWKAVWTRRIVGDGVYREASYQFDVSHTGTQEGYNEPGYVGLKTEERVQGPAGSAAGTMTLDEYYYTTYTHNSNVGHVVRNWQLTVNSTLLRDGATYGFDTASARWEASSLLNDPLALNVVREPGYWAVTGTFVANDQVVGQVAFDGPVIIDTNGPGLVINWNDGGQTNLHTLVPGPGE